MITLEKIKINKRVVIYLLLFCFISCAGQIDTPTSQGEETQLTLILNTGNYITRAGETDDTAINSLHVVIFEKESGNYQYKYLTTASRGENANQYNVRLYTTENSLKLLLIGDISNTATLIDGAPTEDEIREDLVLNFYGEETAHLPMYGEIVYENGISAEGVPNGEISMLRSVAGVDISIKNELAGTFVLKSIQAYRANNRIQVIPDPSAIASDEWKVTNPFIPLDAESVITTSLVNAEEVTEASPVRIYLPESEAPADVTADATCLIIGGIYTGSGHTGNTTVTYYRVDFKGESQPTGQILRNHLYKIKITGVDGPGTTHPDDADEQNIQTIIYDWGDSKHEVEL